MTAPRRCATARSSPTASTSTTHACSPPRFSGGMLQYQEFDASEMSLSNYTTLVSERQFAVHRHPGVSVARVPPRLFLHQHRQGHQERRRPQGQARRRAGIFDDRGGLHARAAAARVRREADRRRMGAGPRRPARPQAARRHQADPGAGRHRARRSAGARRDRLHDDGEQSAVVPPRLAEGARGCSRTTPRWRRTITGAPRSIRSCTRW